MFGVQIANLKSKDYIEKGTQMQGANYSLNQGLNYKLFETSRVKVKIATVISKRRRFEGSVHLLLL